MTCFCRHMSFAPWLRRTPRLLCVLASLLMAAGCMAGAVRHNGVTSSRVMGVSRFYIPSDGGQTIRPPQRMADVTTLWMPLKREERKKFIVGHVDERASGSLQISAWLPSSEGEVMRDYLYRLTVSQARLTRRVLDRARAFLPMIRDILVEQELPLELAALPLVESAFEPRAVSPAGAAGLWQLMPETARRFGLVVNAGQDERFDPRKATEAAAQYLIWLYRYFHDWPLALAAYNCGEGAMDSFLRKYGASSLAELSSRGKGNIPMETLRFVPKFIAAATAMAESGLLQTADRAGEQVPDSAAPADGIDMASPGLVPPSEPGTKPERFFRQTMPIPLMRRISS